MKSIEVDISKPKNNSGAVSQVAWNTASTIRGLRQIFNCRDHERITNIELTEVGIKANIERD
jgi:hypothetical protein